MKAEYKKLLPQWYKDTKKYDLLLTDDIDSLLSCAILKQVKGWDIEHCLLFKVDSENTFDILGKTNNAKNEMIGVDLALMKGKCFDNHVTRLQKTDYINPENFNPNIIKDVVHSNYTDKYNLSTVLLLWSLYDLPIPKSEDGKMILLGIDGSFSSYYKQAFRPQNKFWLCDVLGLDELYECQQRHTVSDFGKIMEKYNLSAKLQGQKSGILKTDIDLVGVNFALLDTDIWCEIPQRAFKWYKKLKDSQVPIQSASTKMANLTKNPFSFALTKKWFACYSEEF